jgi:hypothetical protein
MLINKSNNLLVICTFYHKIDSHFYHYIPWHKKNIFWAEDYLLDLLINKNNSLKFQDKLSEKMIDMNLFIVCE